jgi:hypothetical protein
VGQIDLTAPGADDFHEGGAPLVVEDDLRLWLTLLPFRIRDLGPLKLGVFPFGLLTFNALALDNLTGGRLSCNDRHRRYGNLQEKKGPKNTQFPCNEMRSIT